MFDLDDDSLTTRDRLMRVTAESLMRHSFADISVDDICRAADVKKGTLYHHFPSKTDLAIAGYDYLMAFANAKIAPCFDRSLKPMQRLQRYADESYLFLKAMFEKEGRLCGCPVSIMGNEGAPQDDRLRNKIKEMFDMHCAYFESVLRDLPAYAALPDEEIKAVAHGMFSFTMGVKYQAKIMEDPTVVQQQLMPGLLRLVRVEEE